ncbi:Uncharacterized conserved protein, DUF58 family, contains vWF domain [Marininema mesophilum]|uniref:Uncharacterized conserved protein, DUF58 family, contains vWF domain n=1 Tax=Marininema mesophilum TaxID=1048340 RepID=A0A1H2ZKQ4_9BACL|nr:DUF58 domain-containing protein [Marininema mesophilum]SDX17299.1 Uncharacterized conserved protein, DUF58 family, contains vWF domain [Marininema mesophilum]
MTSSGRSSVQSQSHGSGWLPTSRFLGWFALGVAVTGAGAIFGIAFLCAILYYSGLMVVTTREALTLRSVGHLMITRESDPFFELGEEHLIHLSAKSNYDGNLTLTLKDDIPTSFHTNEGEISFSLSKRRSGTATYYIYPNQRGLHRFGNIHLRITGPWGFIQRQQRADMAEDKRVYPLLKEVRRVRGGVYRKRTDIEGTYRRKGIGQSLEYSHIREYVQGDDPRWINWKATARLNKPAVNVQRPEQGQHVVIFLDCGRVMGARDRVKTRLDLAIEGALAFAAAALTRGDQVGLIAFSNRITSWVPSGKGDSQLKRLIEAMAGLEAEYVESAYRVAMEHLATHYKRRALVAVFTDAGNLTFAEELAQQITVLRRRHLILTVTMQDPRLQQEIDKYPHQEDDVFRKAVVEGMMIERHERLHHLRRQGVIVLDVPPGQLSTSAIHTYIDLKNRSLL